jgi:hypothetical protein
MRSRVALIGIGLLVASCATTTALTPERAAPLALKAMGDNAIVYWVPAAQTAIARAMAQSVLTADMPVVQSLKEAIAPAAREPLRLAVAGTDSAHTALVLRLALNATAGDLPQLQLVFIGSPAHEAEVRTAVQAKRGRFVFEAQPS